jgi:intracellular multiplication protein IcmC
MLIDTKLKRGGLSYVETSVFFVITYFLFTSLAFAAVPDVVTMLENFAKTVPELMYFTTALAYVFGFWFVVHGLVLLKKYGMQRTQMSGDASLAAPLLSIFVGAAMIYLPSTIQAGMETFWMNPNPYHYGVSESEGWNTFAGACFMIIQLVGVIAFMRGLMILTKLGGGGQQASFGKATAHIVGGIFCINMRDFLQSVFETLGLSGVLPGL